MNKQFCSAGWMALEVCKAEEYIESIWWSSDWNCYIHPSMCELAISIDCGKVCLYIPIVHLIWFQPRFYSKREIHALVDKISFSRWSKVGKLLRCWRDLDRLPLLRTPYKSVARARWMLFESIICGFFVITQSLLASVAPKSFSHVIWLCG